MFSSNVNWFIAGISLGLTCCAIALWQLDVIGWYKHRSSMHNHVRQLLQENKHHVDGDRVLCYDDDYLQPNLGREFSMSAAVGHYMNQIQSTKRSKSMSPEPKQQNIPEPTTAKQGGLDHDGLPIPIDVRKTNTGSSGSQSEPSGYNPNL